MKYIYLFTKFNVIDYILLSVIMIFSLLSFFRGFTREFSSICIWILGMWIAAKYYGIIETFLMNYISNPSFRFIISFGILMVISTILGGMIINHVVSIFIVKLKLEKIDQILGLIFGIIRGGIWISIFLLIFSSTVFTNHKWWKMSILIPYFQDFGKWIYSILPSVVINLINSFYK